MESGFKQYYSKFFMKGLEDWYGTEIADKWNLAIQSKLFSPEYHGREHIHIDSWMRGITDDSSETRQAFSDGIYTLLDQRFLTNRKFAAAYSPKNSSEIESLNQNLKKGIQAFESAFNVIPTLFTPPAGGYTHEYDNMLRLHGIKAVTLSRWATITSKSGKNRKAFYYFGKKLKKGIFAVPRNCLFEPHQKREKSVEHCISNVSEAFRYHQPAIISSHRINFVNQHLAFNSNGLGHLENLLSKIVAKWPDVEFMSSKELYGSLHESKK